ncbi:hypothetical protein MVES1_001827 [Malassezia vespertilionis]|nr:uncharacterized protein MVES1_001827 [Malassezia vespertilionis]WFD06482.1 hypothetical protein MVES1_001827 [Malassezia vespertilionis]
MTQALDHFDGATNATFQQRYFLDMHWYDSGASKRMRKNGKEIVPVIVYDGGESDIDARRPMLETGIVRLLAEATGGIGIVLEHRYYGTSLPDRAALGNGSDWGVDQLRWLNTRQSLHDSASFIERMRFPGVGTDAEVRVIYYGGSYAGARAAFMRKTYPNLVHGAIASSAVVGASVDLPEYYYAVARYSPSKCAQAMQHAVHALDAIIAPSEEVNVTQADALRSLFNASNVTSLDDFASLVAVPLGIFQSNTWENDARVSPWQRFCASLVNGTRAAQLRKEHALALAQLPSVPDTLLNWGDVVRGLLPESGDAWRMSDPSFFRQDGGVLSDNKAWTFQVCTEYGYYQLAPPIPHLATGQASGPKILSARIDARLYQTLCDQGFTPGTHFAMPKTPNVSIPNAYGNMHLAVDRLAFIDGQADPWRSMTPHSEEYAFGGNRPDTINRPFKLIPDCWHHCDSTALLNRTAEPERIQNVHNEQEAFVRAWLKE